MNCLSDSVYYVYDCETGSVLPGKDIVTLVSFEEDDDVWIDRLISQVSEYRYNFGTKDQISGAIHTYGRYFWRVYVNSEHIGFAFLSNIPLVGYIISVFFNDLPYKNRTGICYRAGVLVTDFAQQLPDSGGKVIGHVDKRNRKVARMFRSAGYRYLNEYSENGAVILVFEKKLENIICGG